MTDEVTRYNEYARRISAGGTKHIPGVQLTLFENYSIRRTWDDGQWWYSCVDCMIPLSGTKNARRYWSDYKKRVLSEEGLDVYANIVHGKRLPDSKGRMQVTDTANAEGLLHIVQSVPSPKAEPFKAWLAPVGAMVSPRHGIPYRSRQCA